MSGFLRRPVKECCRSLMNLQIRNLESIQNNENSASVGGRRGGASFASSMSQRCLPPRMPLRISSSGRPVGLMACRIKLSK